MSDPLVLGLDYGSDSARAVLVRVRDGKELGSAVHNYTRWANGQYCNPKVVQYRQHPLDYIEAAEYVIKTVLKNAGPEASKQVVGLGFDTTGSTPCMVDETCTPLAMRADFAENPNAMFILWKDHTSVQEAAAINALAHKSTPDYTSFCGGTYSSEWFWSKALHVIRTDATVAQAAYGVVECSEWLPAFFTGVRSYDKLVRARCACGHKAMWNESWGGFPPRSFFEQLHPRLGIFRSRMSDVTETVDKPVGTLTEEWARRLGLSTKVVVAGGAIDAHFGAVGAGIKAHSFVRVMGTSTCDMMVIDPSVLGQRRVQGICGQVDGSIIPHMIGMEAGQSAYGDVFAWFSKLLQYSSTHVIAKSSALDDGTKTKLIREVKKKMLTTLSEDAARLHPGETSVYALDWFNGRRTPDANQHLKSVIGGLTLGSDAPSIYRALVEATAFGSRAIVERFRREGVRIDNVIAVGGIAKKSPLTIQILADVLNMPITVCRSAQVCALGSAIAAATAAGCYKTIPEAQDKMASGSSTSYQPSAEAAKVYDALYKRYQELAAKTEQMYAHM
ncbi:putative L-ribulokinase [Leptomonas pyrrhocoris]|uniref:Putative L-ribulokinase n=1 Tax=Leptomonas pyrrhocoris TaxID=157538 RepID=A0A0N0DV36_LEPPY|nr:putative L-ribulokinase [Leptomonas pyrrhocoris]KPA79811.1 putative L-ribulokinase [Leptomonas pyrrhocoris]|eukprot:XP_015658250.1 putative L-ribulokinase [Leptomonas pyrrhocoris]